MESTRQQKVARLLQKNLGEIFQAEARNYPAGTLLTVTQVQVSKDLSVAKVFISVFSNFDKKAIFNHILEKNKEIRFHLGQKVRNQLRIIPELHFIFDDSLDYIENIERLLKS